MGLPALGWRRRRRLGRQLLLLGLVALVESVVNRVARGQAEPVHLDSIVVSATAPWMPERVCSLRARANHHPSGSGHMCGGCTLPRMVADGQDVFAVPGEEERAIGYWRDVASIDAFWEAQMDLIIIEVHPMFNLYNDRWPIRTGATHDPPAKFVFRDEAHARVGIATDSMVSHGCIISGGRIHRSVLSIGCSINSFSEVEECVLFERVRVRRSARLQRCIIDKDVEIPSGVEVGFPRGRPEAILPHGQPAVGHPEARRPR